MPTYELKPIYDGRRSFYGKARIDEDEQGTHLYSYDTLVVSIWRDPKKVTLYSAWDHSMTTLRHVKEFLQQHNLFCGSKQEIKDYYGVD